MSSIAGIPRNRTGTRHGEVPPSAHRACLQRGGDHSRGDRGHSQRRLRLRGRQRRLHGFDAVHLPGKRLRRHRPPGEPGVGGRVPDRHAVCLPSRLRLRRSVRRGQAAPAGIRARADRGHRRQRHRHRLAFRGPQEAPHAAHGRQPPHIVRHQAHHRPHHQGPYLGHALLQPPHDGAFGFRHQRGARARHLGLPHPQRARARARGAGDGGRAFRRQKLPEHEDVRGLHGAHPAVGAVHTVLPKKARKIPAEVPAREGSPATTPARPSATAGAPAAAAGRPPAPASATASLPLAMSDELVGKEAL